MGAKAADDSGSCKANKTWIWGRASDSPVCGHLSLWCLLELTGSHLGINGRM